MTPFLKQVAQGYFEAGDISSACFIFPNRRAQVFFSKYLGEETARSGKPIVAPKMVTMSDFFYAVSGCSPTDKISLLLDLYECYAKLNSKAESLDDFIFWGDVILADFDDVDKYLADPEMIFTNVSDFRKIQDTYSYLTDTQRKAIESFVRNFSAGGRLTVDLGSDDPNVKERFLLIWNILYPLYRDFNALLESKGRAYEGMVYRNMAERIENEAVVDVLAKVYGEGRRYVFTGLNALNECERKVMGKMRYAGVAEFCWDFSSEMIRDKQNKSSYFMSKNVTDFPQSLKFDADGLKTPEIEVIGVPSFVGQAKLLSKIGVTDKSAVVLPDENMLVPVLNSIPPEIEDINVTMGRSINGSAFYDFFNLLNAMQLHLRFKDGKWYFYHVQVWAVFASGIFRSIIQDNVLADKRIQDIKKEKRYYIPIDDLTGPFDAAAAASPGASGESSAATGTSQTAISAAASGTSETAAAPEPSANGSASAATSGTADGQAMADAAAGIFNVIFRPAVTDLKSASKEQTAAIADYLIEVIKFIAPVMASDPSMATELEYARAAYNAVRRLKAMDLEVLPSTWLRLLDRLLSVISVPFKGEPLKGLQIMGPLETRALDFKHVIILSCNEGIFPHRNVSSSFIPPELRRGFGLPTYEYQDAVWAYYFYRLIQRAEKVTLVYDTRTEGYALAGEESRYVKQLEYHFNLPVRRKFVKTETASSPVPPEISKTEEDVQAIRNATLSASSLKSYLDCPAKFYYSVVRKIHARDEVSEDMDAGMIGNVFHHTMEWIYTQRSASAAETIPGSQSGGADGVATGGMPNTWDVTKEYLEKTLKDKGGIAAKIRGEILGQLNSLEVSGRDLVMERLIMDYVTKTLQRDIELLKSTGLDRFRMIGCEMKFFQKIEGFNFIGYVDRMDSLRPGELRIIDYKTGKVQDDDLKVSDADAPKTVENLFRPDNEKRPKNTLQLYLYDVFCRNDPKFKGMSMVNSIYSPPQLFKEGVREVPLGEEFTKLMDEALKALLKEMVSLEIPFRRTSAEKICSYCDFKMICGR